MTYGHDSVAEGLADTLFPPRIAPRCRPNGRPAKVAMRRSAAKRRSTILRSAGAIRDHPPNS